MATLKETTPDPDVEAAIKEAVDVLSEKLPEGYGLALIAFRPEEGVGLRVHASSNMPHQLIAPVVSMVGHRWME